MTVRTLINMCLCLSTSALCVNLDTYCKSMFLSRCMVRNGYWVCNYTVASSQAHRDTHFVYFLRKHAILSCASLRSSHVRSSCGCVCLRKLYINLPSTSLWPNWKRFSVIVWWILITFDWSTVWRWQFGRKHATNVSGLSAFIWKYCLPFTLCCHSKWYIWSVFVSFNIRSVFAFRWH